MNELLKRLTLIKLSIEINETELIDEQIGRICLSPALDSDLRAILAKLERKEYGTAIKEIELYLSLKKPEELAIYEDSELQGLRTELNVLEERIRELSCQRDEYAREIDDFNTEYNIRLGGLISGILERKKENLRRKREQKYKEFVDRKDIYEQCKDDIERLKEKIRLTEELLGEIDEFDDDYDALFEELQALRLELLDKERELNDRRKEAKSEKIHMDNDTIHEEYREAEKDYDEFCGGYQEVVSKERLDISDEEKKELKMLYRKGVKLCHPDIVAPDDREEATRIIAMLNDAYEKRDLEGIREILQEIGKSSTFTVQEKKEINDKELLRGKIAGVRSRIAAVEQEIEQIRNDDTYRNIQKIDDWDAYFAEIEKALREEYDQLLQESSAVPDAEPDSEGAEAATQSSR